MPGSQRLVAAALVVAVGCAVGGAGAAAEPGPPVTWAFEPKDEAAAQRLKLQSTALDLINKASAHVFKTMPWCRPKLPDTSAKTTHDAPSQAVLDALAPLRRPAGAGVPSAAARRPFFPGGETYGDYVRPVETINGVRLTLVIARSVRPSYRPTPRCLDAEHARLAELVADVPAKVRSAALREFATLRRSHELNASRPTAPQDGIYLFGRSGGGGGAGIADFLEHGTFISIGSGPRRTGRPRSTLNGLVPDGVATVTLEYPRIVSRGRDFKPTVYPSAYTRTVHVHDNVLSIHIPRDVVDAFPPRMVWRDAGGRVVHVAKQQAAGLVVHPWTRSTRAGVSKGSSASAAGPAPRGTP